MNEDVIQNIAKDSGQISGTMILLILYGIGWLFERIYKMTRHQNNGVPTWKDINNKLDKKINSEDCKSFKTRIGKESDIHTQNIFDIKDGITTIKTDIGYIKGKLLG